MEEKLLRELNEKIDRLSKKIEEIQDEIPGLITGNLYNAVEEIFEDMSENFREEVKSTMYILSQDKKLLSPFISIQANRLKKDEEPYCINARIPNNHLCIGRYKDKESALIEMQRIAQALAAGKTLYEVQ